MVELISTDKFLESIIGVTGSNFNYIAALTKQVQAPYNRINKQYKNQLRYVFNYLVHQF